MSEVDDRSTLIQPEVMMAPIVWLSQRGQNGVSGRRIIAKDWDADRLHARHPRRSAPRRGWWEYTQESQAEQHRVTSHRNQAQEPINRRNTRCGSTSRIGHYAYGAMVEKRTSS